jgi:hypothetical protein
MSEAQLAREAVESCRASRLRADRSRVLHLRDDRSTPIGVGESRHEPRDLGLRLVDLARALTLARASATGVARRIRDREEPFLIEQMWADLYLRTHSGRHTCTFTTPAISAVEVACSDSIGKVCNQPGYNFLGWANDRLHAYPYLPVVSDDPVLLADGAAAHVEKGLTALKIDPVKARVLYGTWRQWKRSSSGSARSKLGTARCRPAPRRNTTS